jgi:thiamine kinase-like enzyme
LRRRGEEPMSQPESDEASLDNVLDLVPELAEAERTVADLEGGLTNRNYKVTTADGAYVVRRWSDDGALLSIDRDNEHQNSVAAAEAGIGAPVVAYLPEEKALVIEFIEGPTLSADDFREGSWMGPVAEACRRLHSADAFRDDFDMFEIQATYLKLVDERGFRLPERYREFGPQVAEIRAAMRAHPEDRVPCNNDLLAENFIDSPDGLRLIDYEYSGNNEPSFELGNIWSESNLSLDQLAELVGAYWGEVTAAKVARARLWGLMSKYGWTLWASIQDGVSDIDFDFWAWGMEKYERAVTEFDGPDFARLLDEVRAG